MSKKVNTFFAGFLFISLVFACNDFCVYQQENSTQSNGNTKKEASEEKNEKSSSNLKDVECVSEKRVGLTVCRPQVCDREMMSKPILKKLRLNCENGLLVGDIRGYIESEEYEKIDTQNPWRFKDVKWATHEFGLTAAIVMHFPLKTTGKEPIKEFISKIVKRELSKEPDCVLTISAIPNVALSKILNSPKDYIENTINRICKEEEEKLALQDRDWLRRLKNKKKLTLQDYMEITVMATKCAQLQPDMIEKEQKLQKRYKKIAQKNRSVNFTSFLSRFKDTTESVKIQIIFLEDMYFTFTFKIFENVLPAEEQSKLEEEIDNILANIEITEPKTEENKTLGGKGEDEGISIPDESTIKGNECEEIKSAGIKICKPTEAASKVDNKIESPAHKGGASWQFYVPPERWSPSINNNRVIGLVYSTKIGNSVTSEGEKNKPLLPSAIVTVRAIPNAFITVFLQNKAFREVDICKDTAQLTHDEKVWIDKILGKPALSFQDFVELTIKKIMYCEFDEPEKIVDALANLKTISKMIAKKSRFTYETNFQGRMHIATYSKLNGIMKVIVLPETNMTYTFEIFTVSDLSDEDKKDVARDIDYILENIEIFKPLKRDK